MDSNIDKQDIVPENHEESTKPYINHNEKEHLNQDGQQGEINIEGDKINQDSTQDKAKLAKIGRPVSGKNWKKISKKSSQKDVKSGLQRMPWQKKRQLAEAQKRLTEKIRQLREEDAEKKKNHRAAQKEKEKLKEENMMKGSTYKLIKDSTKIRKWNKKARTELMKLPSSIFEKIVKKEYNY